MHPRRIMAHECRAVSSHASTASTHLPVSLSYLEYMVIMTSFKSASPPNENIWEKHSNFDHCRSQQMKFNVAIKKFNNELQTLSTNGREFDALDGALTSVSGC